MTPTMTPEPLSSARDRNDQQHADAALAGRIDRALRGTGYLALRGLRVTVVGGRVTLAGRVSSYYLKQVAQEAVLSVAGACRLRNDVEVTRPQPALALCD
jgi:osmotically-inducible protein OsmY